MSHHPLLHEFGIDASEAFTNAGLALAATYQGPASATLTPCSVLFSQPDMTRTGGSDGQTTGQRTEITLFRVHVTEPRRGGRVVLEHDASAWLLDEPQHANASHSRWTVTRDR